MKIKFGFRLAWYDFWVGFYYDRRAETLYVCPLPMLCLSAQLKHRLPDFPYVDDMKRDARHG